jgi:general secretion pathway protein B
MSFILDALKKSEIERQRQSLPGLVETPLAQRRRFPVWAVGLSVLLIINIAVLTGVLLRNNSQPKPPAPAKPTHTVQATPDKALPAVDEHFSPLAAAPAAPAAPVYAPEIPVAAAPSQPATALAAPPAPPRDVVRAVAHRTDPVLTSNDADTDTDEVLPSISQVNLKGSEALPELHLDVHVYATRPADRFVYINMHKYREGSALPEGPTVERIRRDGVVLNYQGLRFILPRQS